MGALPSHQFFFVATCDYLGLYVGNIQEFGTEVCPTWTTQFGTNHPIPSAIELPGFHRPQVTPKAGEGRFLQMTLGQL